MKKTISILLLMVIFIAAYVISTQIWDYTYISTIVATVVASMGIFGVWIQLRKDASIKEAEFLMSFNFTFITTEKFVRIEHRLEKCRLNDEKLNLTEADRQDIVDYLVYLESLAPLVLNKMVRLEVIDDLFGYRFFIAVNNKEIQEFELCPEAQFYRGCFKLYKIWKEYRKKKKLPIPLEKSSLDHWKRFDTYS